MKAERLLECLNGVDEALLCRCERSVAAHRIGRIAVSVALCLCLVITAVALVPEKEAPLPPPANGNWTVNYIQEQESMVSPETNPYPTGFEYFGSFYEDLNEQEIKAVLPKDRPEWMDVTGKSRFDRHGVLWELELDVSTTIPDQTVSVSFRLFPAIKDLERVSSEDDSICNGVVYRVFERPAEDGTTKLYAATVRELFIVTFEIVLPDDCLEQGKQDFKQILESFTYYGEKNKPNWSKITYEYIPEYYSKKLTLEAAREDPAFGALVPECYPTGELQNEYIDYLSYNLVRTYISRYKDSEENYLRVKYDGIFKARANVTWQISYFDEDIHTRHLVHVDEDWASATSPIFYIEELTPAVLSQLVYEIMNNEWLGDFDIGIKCGAYYVSIDATADVDPLWIRHAIEQLHEKF